MRTPIAVDGVRPLRSIPMNLLGWASDELAVVCVELVAPGEGALFVAGGTIGAEGRFGEVCAVDILEA